MACLGGLQLNGSRLPSSPSYRGWMRRWGGHGNESQPPMLPPTTPMCHSVGLGTTISPAVSQLASPRLKHPSASDSILLWGDWKAARPTPQPDCGGHGRLTQLANDGWLNRPRSRAGSILPISEDYTGSSWRRARGGGAVGEGGGGGSCHHVAY